MIEWLATLPWYCWVGMLVMAGTFTVFGAMAILEWIARQTS